MDFSACLCTGMELIESDFASVCHFKSPGPDTSFFSILNTLEVVFFSQTHVGCYEMQLFAHSVWIYTLLMTGSCRHWPLQSYYMNLVTCWIIWLLLNILSVCWTKRENSHNFESFTYFMWRKLGPLLWVITKQECVVAPKQLERMHVQNAQNGGETENYEIWLKRSYLKVYSAKQRQVFGLMLRDCR